MKKSVYAAIRSIAWLLFWWPQRFAPIRRLVFDSARPGSLIYADLGKDRFLVSAGDKIISRDIFMHGSYDIQKLHLAVSLLEGRAKLTTLIDIGANLGCICIPAVSSGAFSRAIAVEPDPRNFRLLVANVAINGLETRITSHNLALGDQDGELHFELSKDNFGDHRVRRSGDAGAQGEGDRETISVNATTLDRLLAPADLENALVWMDTQGYEGVILSGAGKALGPKLPLVLEFWPYGMKRTGAFPLMKSALLWAGYSHFYELIGNPPERLPLTEANLDELFRRLEGEAGRFTDILVV
jgi:FkbM family methyltransferase